MYFTLLKTTKVGEERIKILFSIVLSHQSAMIRASSRQKNSEDQRVISPHVAVMLYSSGFTMFGIIVIVSTATWPITNFQSLFSLYLLPVLAFPLLHLIFPCCLCPQTLLTTTNQMMPLHVLLLLLHCLSFPPQVLASAVKLLPPMPSQSLCHQLAYSLSAPKLSSAILHNQFSPQSPYCSCTRPSFSTVLTRPPMLLHLLHPIIPIKHHCPTKTSLITNRYFLQPYDRLSMFPVAACQQLAPQHQDNLGS